jgi:hypothetical protein
MGVLLHFNLFNDQPGDWARHIHDRLVSVRYLK